MKMENRGDCPCKEPAAPPPFEDLYREYKNAVYAYAYHLTRNREEADDLFQESWLRIVKKMPEQVKIDSLKAWIFTVITNIYRDDLRKRKIRRLFLFEKTKNYPVREALDVQPRISPQEVNIEMTNLNREIFAAINRLPEKQRTIFILKEISGFKQVEIGNILEIPVGTVKSLMHRAVKRLQRELAVFRAKSIEVRGQNEV